MRWGGGEKLLGRSRAPPPPLALSPPPWKATENPEVAVGGSPRLVQYPLRGGCRGDPGPLCTPAPSSRLTCWHSVCLSVSSGGTGPCGVSAPGLSPQGGKGLGLNGGNESVGGGGGMKEGEGG